MVLGTWARVAVVSLGWVLAVVGAGCARPPSARFGDGAFHPRRDHYRIAFDDVSTCSVLDPVWTLVNYEGRPESCDRSPRTGRDFMIRYRLDHDGDGRTDADSLEQRADLLLEHAVDGTSIAVSTIPLDASLEARALSVLAHDYLEWLSGRSEVEIDLDAAVRVRSRAPRLARLVSERERVVGGQPAFEIRFDVLDGERARVDPAYVPPRREMILLRPSGHRWRTARVGITGSASWPMVVVVRFEGDPSRLELHRAELESLLERFVVTEPDGD